MEIKRKVEVIMNKCCKCEYEWVRRVKVPKQCPRCKRYDYLEPKKEDK